MNDELGHDTDGHRQRILRHTSTVGRPKQGRSAWATSVRSLTTTGPPHAPQPGRWPRVHGDDEAVAVLAHLEHVHRRKADKQFTHARSISRHRGSSDLETLNISRFVGPLSCRDPQPQLTPRSSVKRPVGSGVLSPRR